MYVLLELFFVRSVVVLPSPLSFSWVLSGCYSYRLYLLQYPVAVTLCPFLLQSCLIWRCNCHAVCLLFCVFVFMYLALVSKLSILSCSCCIVHCVLHYDIGVLLHSILLLLLLLICHLTVASLCIRCDSGSTFGGECVFSV